MFRAAQHAVVVVRAPHARWANFAVLTWCCSWWSVNERCYATAHPHHPTARMHARRCVPGHCLCTHGTCDPLLLRGGPYLLYLPQIPYALRSVLFFYVPLPAHICSVRNIPYTYYPAFPNLTRFPLHAPFAPHLLQAATTYHITSNRSLSSTTTAVTDVGDCLGDALLAPLPGTRPTAATHLNTFLTPTTPAHLQPLDRFTFRLALSPYFSCLHLPAWVLATPEKTLHYTAAFWHCLCLAGAHLPPFLQRPYHRAFGFQVVTTSSPRPHLEVGGELHPLMTGGRDDRRGGRR